MDELRERLARMRANGDLWITITAVLVMLDNIELKQTK